MPNAKLRSHLLVPCIRCQARLGWGEDERSQPQGVSVRLDIGFTEPLAALESDHLSDTVDVAELTQLVTVVCAKAPFRLLERLAQTLYDAVRTLLPPGATIWVEVGKEHPPLSELAESARFGTGDAEPLSLSMGRPSW